MAFSRLYMHMLWSTKHRLPILTRELRAELFRYIGGIVKGLGAYPEIVNGVEDHVHMLVRVPTTLSAAVLAQKAKGESSRWANKKAGRRVLKWQVKYGAFSVNPREIDIVRDYISNQENHHKRKTFKEEMKQLLDELGIEYDEAYMWE